jgi:myosin-5
MGSGNALEVCKQLLREFRIPPDMYQIGRTKLFFRAGVLGHLEDTSARLNRCGQGPVH